MGIIDALFEPNVEKLRLKKDVVGLIKALEYPKSHVRIAAAKALGEIRDDRAVEPLILFRDKEKRVRKVVAKALGNIGGTIATRIIRVKLEKITLMERETGIEPATSSLEERRSTS